MLRNDNSVFWLVLLSDTLVQTLMAVFEFDAALQEAVQSISFYAIEESGKQTKAV